MPDDLSRLRSYDDLTNRIWRDKRLTAGTRELLLATAWVLCRDPDFDSVPKAERGTHPWRQLAIMLGRDDRLRRPTPRYKQLVADDAPRYVPPNTWGDRFCEAPRIRPYRPRNTGSGIVSPTCLIGRHPHAGECRRAVVHSAASATAVPKPAADPSDTCDAPAKLDFHLVERDPRPAPGPLRAGEDAVGERARSAGAGAEHRRSAAVLLQGRLGADLHGAAAGLDRAGIRDRGGRLAGCGYRWCDAAASEAAADRGGDG